MADSGSKLLASICLRGSRSESSSSNSSSHTYGGGCVNLFFAHLFDWNRKLASSKGFLKAAVAAERMHQQASSKSKKKKKQQQQQHQDERLPMAKLLLIADENRRSPRRNMSPIGEESSSNSSSISSSSSSPAVNAVARLMGLEQMPVSPNPTATTVAKQVSLQELLHLDHEEHHEEPPQMLQELLICSKPASKRQQQHFHEDLQRISPSQQEALFSLLMQEVVQSSKDEVPRARRQNKQQQQKKKKSGNSKCRNGAFSAPLAPVASSSGCGRGFGKNLFLEAAAKILEPRSSNTRRPILSSSCAAAAAAAAASPLDNEDFDLTRSMPFKRRAAISAPCSPVSRHHLHRDVSCCSTSTTTSSILELFYDDLEAAAAAAAEDEDDYDYFHAMSEPCSPYLDKSPCSSSSRTTWTPQREVRHLRGHKRVPFHDLGEHDYVSFRDFLTRSSPSSSSASSSSRSCSQASTPPPSCNQRACSDDEHAAAKFTMVHNPLFEYHAPPASTSDDVGSTTFETTSECEEDMDDGLEDILKSILSDANKEQTRITWSPQESYMFNKEPSEGGKSSLDDSSESNCGEGQPSPVSVLDNSPFDDDLHRKDRRSPSSRKRLDFDELHLSPVLESSPRSTQVSRDESFKSTEEEVPDYVNMVLRECGVEHHNEALLVLLEPCIMDDELFERLEDRVRVTELIKHLEAYNRGSNKSNMNTLKSHCRSYHECRAQRRLLFDFTCECLASVLEEACNKMDPSNNSKNLFLSSGRDVAQEVELRVAQRTRDKKLLDNIDLLVEKDFGKEWQGSTNSELCRLVLHCENEIIQGLVSDLASDLLA